MIKIHHGEYLISAPKLSQCPDLNAANEIVFVGRSNVGKSSLINSLTQYKNLARTSNTPGKTRYINYYKISASTKNAPSGHPSMLYFVDLPGYGYAKVSQAEQQHWQKNLEDYLKNRESIQLVIQLIDSRHGPMGSDIQMLDWLRFHNHKVLVVLTKIDKLSRSQVSRQCEQARAALSQLIKPDDVIACSSEKHTGRDKLWGVLQQYLQPQ